jgi:23S rRNA (adenine-N6)-dimethyltransferase
VAGPSRRAWGWHPLTDEWAARIVADAGVRTGELVLDIGAGRGALTRHLVASGARVLAIEPHPGRARFLRDRFAGDAVTVAEVPVAELHLPHRPFRVVASPPFAVSSELVRLLLRRDSRMVAADLVLQRAAARRLVEDPPYGRTRWMLRCGAPIPRRAFVMRPQVDATVLVIRASGKAV